LRLTGDFLWKILSPSLDGMDTKNILGFCGICCVSSLALWGDPGREALEALRRNGLRWGLEIISREDASFWEREQAEYTRLVRNKLAGLEAQGRNTVMLQRVLAAQRDACSEKMRFLEGQIALARAIREKESFAPNRLKDSFGAEEVDHLLCRLKAHAERLSMPMGLWEQKGSNPFRKFVKMLGGWDCLLASLEEGRGKCSRHQRLWDQVLESCFPSSLPPDVPEGISTKYDLLALAETATLDYEEPFYQFLEEKNRHILQRKLEKFGTQEGAVEILRHSLVFRKNVRWKLAQECGRISALLPRIRDLMAEDLSEVKRRLAEILSETDWELAGIGGDERRIKEAVIRTELDSQGAGTVLLEVKAETLRKTMGLQKSPEGHTFMWFAEMPGGVDCLQHRLASDQARYERQCALWEKMLALVPVGQADH